MAGQSNDFDAAGFRDAIREVMLMGAPVPEGERAKFYWSKTLVYNTPTDANNTPFDPDATVTETQPAAVTVPCGIEYFDSQDMPTVFGSVTATRIKVTLFDEEYDKVKGCSWVVVGGERFFYKKTEVPKALFDAGVYILHFRAENDL